MLKSPFKSRKPEDFRILMLYPNIQMSGVMPQSIGIFTALFKQQGYKVDLFDCTFYQDINFANLGEEADEARSKNRSRPLYQFLLKRVSKFKFNNLESMLLSKSFSESTHINLIIGFRALNLFFSNFSRKIL